jgi:hypothetical protein
MPPVSLDFKKKTPTNNEEFAAILQDIMDKMGFLHNSQLALMRRMIAKKLITPEQIVELMHEEQANKLFVVLISQAEKEFVEKYNSGLKFEYKRSLWHRIKDFFVGAPALDIEIKKQDPNANQTDANR